MAGIRNGAIESLDPNEVFVFGSNLKGRHGAGAARVAKDRFGAKWGVGEGRTGQAYALPTADYDPSQGSGARAFPALELDRIRQSLDGLRVAAESDPGARFLLTRIGMGRSGYREDQIRPLIEGASLPSNVSPYWEWELGGGDSGGVRGLSGPGWSNQEGAGYEVSSRGDKRFSALFARLPDGRSIEDAWGQAKGYVDGRAAKGKPAVHEDFDYWGTYKGLWGQWADANPVLMTELAQKSEGQMLVDRFAKTDNNQARALAELLLERSAVAERSAVIPEQPAAAANPTGQQTADAVQLDLWEKGKRFAGDAWPYLAAAGGAGLVGYAVADLMGRGSGGEEYGVMGQ